MELSYQQTWSHCKLLPHHDYYHYYHYYHYYYFRVFFSVCAAPSSPPVLQLELGQSRNRPDRNSSDLLTGEGRGAASGTGVAPEVAPGVAWALPVPAMGTASTKGGTPREPSPCKQIKSSRLKQGLYKKTPLDVDFAIFFPFLITLESADLSQKSPDSVQR